MKIIFWIARRYLFSKKTHNIINVISIISLIAIMVSTMAMVIVVSAFNGIEDLVENLYDRFDSDIKITLKEGKTFDKSLLNFEEIKTGEETGFYYVIEEECLLKNNDDFISATVKGVENSYLTASNIDSIFYQGNELILKYDEFYFGIIGRGIQARLGVSSNVEHDNSLQILGLNRTKKIQIRDNPFNQKTIPISGVFYSQTPNDEKFIITHIDFVSNLLEYENDVTGFEIWLSPSVSIENYKRELQSKLASNFLVKSKFDQNALIYQATKNEKFATYVVLSFILLIASFNIIASITMLVMEKKKDIFTLSSLGMTFKKIEQVFFIEGFLITIIGSFLGILVGVLICLLQINFQFVKMSGMIVESYPIKMNYGEVFLIFVISITIGFLSSYFPSKYLIKNLQKYKI